VEIVVAPPFTALHAVAEASRNSTVGVAGQDVHWEKEGAFTGEISPIMLKKLNVSYVIVGHSERREIFGETDEQVNRKVRAVLAHEMTPIVCVGETLEEHEAGATEGKVLGQVAAAFAGVAKDQVASCVVAYEPIWAIGTGKTATADDAQATIALIRGAVIESANEAAGEAVRIQYGGSVKPGNIAELMGRPDIDGALVGGASLDPEDFARIVKFSD
jgi:triosephosphate isomerase